MDIYPEIELSKEQHNSIEVLRNKSFPEHQVTRSYYKQLPHMRALKYRDDQLVGYMGLDYRVVSVGDEIYKVLGVSDFCVEQSSQRNGIGTDMLSQLMLHNKAFKSDSQRLAFLMSSLGFVFMALWFSSVTALLTP
ncbi:GNAT family N-acetyltransferase [Vibrio parahaemolyticus]|nr:GNAT family N-acetyltransferase [Vibrio parahaemolyticus]